MTDNDDSLDRIRDHIDCPYHRGNAPRASLTAELQNPMCGDYVRLDLIVAEELVTEAWFVARGCSISQAAASMLTEHMEGKSLCRLREFEAEDMLRLFGAPLTPRRRQCCLLAWAALRQLIDPER